MQVTGLQMRYGDKVAVDGLDLVVERGTITAVLGPNGAGKTTTLETCEGYRRPQAGEVRVLGLDPVRDRRDLLPRIGVMLQGSGAWSGARAMEMLEHIAAMLGLPSPAQRPVRELAATSAQLAHLVVHWTGDEDTHLDPHQLIAPALRASPGSRGEVLTRRELLTQRAVGPTPGEVAQNPFDRAKYIGRRLGVERGNRA